MSWEDVAREHELVPRTGDQDWWQEFLSHRPDVMHRLLGDLYQAAHPHRDRLPTVEELRDLVTPRYSNDPFPAALKELLGDRSVRWLAQQMKVHHSMITRYLRGEREIVSLHDPAGSMYRIEQVARGLRVNPSYFAEYRRLWIMTLLDSAFAAQPNLSIGVWKKFSGIGAEGSNKSRDGNGRS